MRNRWIAIFSSLAAGLLSARVASWAADKPASTAAPAVRYDGHVGQDAYDWKHWSAFWAFQPVRRPAVPPIAPDGNTVKSSSSSPRNEVDAFVVDRLRSKGLTLAPEADKLTLLRRVTFDLIGLPPSPEEVRAFLADRSGDAYEKVIERLLASPHYGERWGRHWLDVARYTPGRVSFPAIKHTAGDSHYRDYVVRAFNNDKPYDRFITEQLAGDLLTPPADRQAHIDQIVAPAFLSIGSWFEMETDPNRLRLEMVDEMINTTTRAFMGISVACARCHDHKFDPIPIQDYYALGGIFRSTRVVGEFSDNWRDGRTRQLRPLALPDQVSANDALRKAIERLEGERWSLLEQRHRQKLADWKAVEPAYRDAANIVLDKSKPLVFHHEAEDFDGQDNLRIAQLQRDGKGVEVIETQTATAQWVKYKVEVAEAAKYRLEVLHSTDDRTPIDVVVNGESARNDALAVPTGGAGLAYQRWDVAATIDLHAGLNFLRLMAKGGNFPRIDRLRYVKIDPAIEAGIQSVAKEQKLVARLLEQFVYWPSEPWPTTAGIEAYLDDKDVAAIAAIDRQVVERSGQIKPYPLAVAVTDQPSPVDLPVYLRGQTYRESAYLVPRGVPRFLDHALPRPEIAAGQSGRLELAHWLTDPRHPLTSRVMVNRIWAWHFGKGLVDSPSDFGSRGSTPTHPELLDWLAATFMEKGWSIKQMHRLILLSATYRQSSQSQATDQVDPDNKLLSHFPRRRLEAEALYDTMLASINTLVRQPSGQPLEFAKSSNRAMYTLTTSRSPPGLGVDVRKMLTLFDVEMEGQPIGSRPTSATPAQSLFWLNSPLVKYFADRFAERLLKMDKLTDAKRVEMAYSLAIGRPPDKAIAGPLLAFVQQAEADGNTRQEAWSRLCQALYASTEFRYVN
ncbi:DUF1549 domain-containing protein [Humisphaera borealis]|uniref:DUF1549 domain-containing protein n=1 Tax=Humisphaera borealis TaxID=2807512 RepID=A0A7M2X618_9BACT|nr:DUF1549 domain-containing protein [Humisphaera borealis]QOV92270.1 DUF1549 domain-containing protein [Humisphaera borealis]